MAVADSPFRARPSPWWPIPGRTTPRRAILRRLVQGIFSALFGMVLSLALPLGGGWSRMHAREDSKGVGVKKEPKQAAKGGGKESKGEKKDESRFAEEEKELKRTISAGQYDKSAAILDELAKTEEVEAYEILMREALAGVDYGLEKYAGELLLKSENPKVLGLVFRTLKSKSANYKTKIVLMGVAARVVDQPGALPAIQAGLKDPYKPVVLAATYWLWRLNRAESIEPLLLELDSREQQGQERVCHDIRRALKSITGADIEAAVDWKNYWEGRKQGLAAPPKPEAGATVLYKPTFFNVAVNSDRVYFMIDTSESMKDKDPDEPESKPEEEKKRRPTTVVVKPQGSTEPVPGKPGSDAEARAKAAAKLPTSRERLWRAKQELMRVIQGLPETTQFGALGFNHELNFLWGPKTIRKATQANKTEAINWVRGWQASGATRSDLALDAALHTPDLDTIYLLTDGAPTIIVEKKTDQDSDVQMFKSQRLEIEPILAHVKEANRFLRCRIHTISFRQIRDSKMKTFVRELAMQSDGTCTLLP
jgi:hypothetical protein